MLAEDLPIEIKESEKAKFMAKAKPNRIPIFEIEAIITGREEKYRAITEKWLKQNNVKYKHLIMAKKGEDGITTKVNAIKRLKPSVFWESDDFQAKMIFLKTGCRVLCLGNLYLYGGNNYNYDKLVKT